MREKITVLRCPAWSRLVGVVGCAAAALFPLPGLECIVRASELLTGPAILQQLRGFQQLGSVLHVAAHPDDENTQLITYLARGRHVRTAYLSITRGDGGQNVLGPEFGEQLGVIRTQELLAARRLDGGQQFFTRAIDFGFSKDYRETLQIWNEQDVLSDVVRVIRVFQPDVIITRFSPDAGRTHGHHTGSAVLAVKAFALSGDPHAFPDQLKTLEPWQPRRVLMNGGGRFGPRGDDSQRENAVTMDISGDDPVLNASFGDIAGQSRAMHKSQGFGNFGGGGRRGPRTESFQLLAGEPASRDIFDGVDTTWNRIPGGGAIDKSANAVIAKFDPQNPGASVADLLALRRQLAALPASRLVNEKRRQLDGIIVACIGLTVETSVPRAEAVPGEAIEFQHAATVRGGVPTRWLATRYPANGFELAEVIDLQPNQTARRQATQTISAQAPLSQPYWLREAPSVGTYHVADTNLIGTPENRPAFSVEHVFDIGGQQFVVDDEQVNVLDHETTEGTRQSLQIVAPIALSFNSEVKTFAPGAAEKVDVQLEATRDGIQGSISLDAPSGWKIVPESQPFKTESAGDVTTLSFGVTPPTQPASVDVIAKAKIDNATFSNRRVEIRYAHIPRILLQPTASLRFVALDMAVRGHEIGYLPGAGDDVAKCLAQMGLHVKTLEAADLNEDELRKLDAVVIGIRAFNVRDDLDSQMPALNAFVESGGNVIVQYNRPEGLRSSKFTPYRLRLSGDRVTDERSAISFLAPEHPALNRPNRITRADFDGWVQERGVYFPNQWDEHFVPIIACNDPGEAPLEGGILVAQHGRGHYVYTSMAWFRQLPAGVPGAYRLFANLISLGKE